MNKVFVNNILFKIIFITSLLTAAFITIPLSSSFPDTKISVYDHGSIIIDDWEWENIENAGGSLKKLSLNNKSKHNFKDIVIRVTFLGADNNLKKGTIDPSTIVTIYDVLPSNSERTFYNIDVPFISKDAKNHKIDIVHAITISKKELKKSLTSQAKYGKRKKITNPVDTKNQDYLTEDEIEISETTPAMGFNISASRPDIKPEEEQEKETETKTYAETKEETPDTTILVNSTPEPILQTPIPTPTEQTKEQVVTKEIAKTEETKIKEENSQEEKELAFPEQEPKNEITDDIEIRSSETASDIAVQETDKQSLTGDSNLIGSEDYIGLTFPTEGSGEFGDGTSSNSSGTDVAVKPAPESNITDDSGIDYEFGKRDGGPPVPQQDIIIKDFKWGGGNVPQTMGLIKEIRLENTSNVNYTKIQLLIEFFSTTGFTPLGSNSVTIYEILPANTELVLEDLNAGFINRIPEKIQITVLDAINLN